MSLLDAPLARLDGTPGTLRDLTGGRPALLVNVASKCGLTPQYTALEALHEEYAPQGFTVVGLPCNQFGGQEPGTAEEIAEFCSATYGVTFVVNMVAYKFLFELFDVHWEWNSTLSLVVAFAISQGTATVVNFAVQRWIIFRKAGVRVVAKQDPA